MGNNLFTTRYGKHINYTYFFKSIEVKPFHKSFCEKQILNNEIIKQQDKMLLTNDDDLKEKVHSLQMKQKLIICNCRKQNKEKTKNNMVAMKKRFIQKAIMNFENEKKLSFLTLTFKENVIDLDFAFKRIKVFFKQLKRDLEKLGLPKEKLKYCYVWENQKRGAIHFHILLNVDMRKDYKAKPITLWNRLNPDTKYKGQWLVNCKNDTNHFVILYFSKYFSKQEQSKSINRRVFLFSKNCVNPVKEKQEINIFELVKKESPKIQKEVNQWINKFLQHEINNEWEHLKEVEIKILLLTIFKNNCFFKPIEYNEYERDINNKKITKTKKIGLVAFEYTTKPIYYGT